MKVLVIGGNGKVGRPLVRRLIESGVTVRVLTRSVERAATIDSRAEAVVADLAEHPASCASAFAGVDAAFMLNQPTFRETVEGLLAVALARSAGVGRFVYQSVFRVDDLAHLPHVAPKQVIQRAVMRSGMKWTVLSPNHFYQNDSMAKADLLETGRYTLPVGPIGCSSVDVEDIAAAATTVLTEAGHEERNYALVGPQALTGADCALAWSEALGRQVTYAGDVDGWQEKMKAVMPAWLNFDLGMMYRDFGRRGFIANEREVAEMHELLGRAPRRYQEYARQQALEWAPSADAFGSGARKGP